MKRLLVGMFAVALSTGAWAYTASDYSQDGLLHQWDAIANVNAYTHDASATVWKDLAAGGALHTKDLSVKDGVMYLPLYMTPML